MKIIESKKMEKKKKKKIRVVGVLIVILFIYLIMSFLYSIWTNPIKKINITGNYYLKENYLINYLDIDNKSILQINSKKVKNKLKKIDLVKDAKIRKNYLGILNIKIEEDKILFYNKNIQKIILTSGKEIDYINDYLGIPSLINFVPDKVYQKFVKELSKIDREILSLVSEIEYAPSIVNKKVVDDQRFLLRMNDGNKVYINSVNIEKFNNYLDILEVIVNKKGNIKGCLYLDSNSENNHFDNCNEDKKVELNGKD